jgi:hypothetical protein
VLLDRKWIKKHQSIPHLYDVIKDVDDSEGVEITLTCNQFSFEWIIEFVKIQTNEVDQLEQIEAKSSEKLSKETEVQLKRKIGEITKENCLNILVTAEFLQLPRVYTRVWEEYFKINFGDIINACKISLSNLNPVIVIEIGKKISELELEKMAERNDKFISHVYKARID